MMVVHVSSYYIYHVWNIFLKPHEKPGLNRQRRDTKNLSTISNNVQARDIKTKFQKWNESFFEK